MLINQKASYGSVYCMMPFCFDSAITITEDTPHSEINLGMKTGFNEAPNRMVKSGWELTEKEFTYEELIAQVMLAASELVPSLCIVL